MVQLLSFLALGFAGAAIASPWVKPVPAHVPDPSPSATKPAAPPQNAFIVITSLSYEGEGCPPGSLEGTLGDGNDFEVVYKNLTASIRPPEKEVKVKCQIKVGLQTTADKQLVIVSGTYSGHVRLTEGAWAKNQNQYKFDKNEGVSNMEWEFKGPTNVETRFTNKLDIEFQSGCNSNGGHFTMIINNYLSMKSEHGNGEGEITVRELDGVVEQSVKLLTTDCPPALPAPAAMPATPAPAAY
ncbi:putative secreted protein [Colletotrichum tanaceti]|uniref:Putative secreted protein n=1 Tax=Colletotrichum tanaceti TaxID=1306861 RepID=A0A4U6X8J8_9PEZI|nr:putative secreted protein [Colletotrichum tanaceti]TKW51504.1 putative secreted protein [Colletotrichum tanaceti]